MRTSLIACIVCCTACGAHRDGTVSGPSTPSAGFDATIVVPPDGSPLASMLAQQSAKQGAEASDRSDAGEPSAGQATAPPFAPDAYPVVFEPPYKQGLRPKLRDARLAREEAQELGVWNEGGRSTKWHPAPRIMIDNPRVAGSLDANAALREARKRHYWPIRKCYDPALAKDPTLRGKVSVRLTVRPSGSVTGPNLVGHSSIDDRDVVRCIVGSFGSLRMPKPRKGRARITLDVSVNPGDAPPPTSEDKSSDPGPGTTDMHALQATLAGKAWEPIRACYMAGCERVPGLWGRMALRVDLSHSGAVRGASETETTFPDAATVRCVEEVLGAVEFPVPDGGDLRVVVPIRFGVQQASSVAP